MIADVDAPDASVARTHHPLKCGRPSSRTTSPGFCKGHGLAAPSPVHLAVAADHHTKHRPTRPLRLILPVVPFFSSYLRCCQIRSKVPKTPFACGGD
mmetsp:Transcript_13892/g.42025  ORF Transcript_13892/g.42025 Transcript_13892/m.42025 type:complete len:97 (+) Transcript_13892:969-1259(+)